MRGKLQLVLALTLGLFVPADGALANSANTQPDAGDGLLVDLGRNDFRTYCAACHGVGGMGDGTVAEFLTIEAANLTELARKNGGIFPRERIEQVIDGRADVKVHGARDMPVWGDWFNAEAVAPDMDAEAREQVVGERIKALIAYIETLQAK